ncbi:MAG: YabP/YqfC family sporulation protein [Oscillospiraceae bacterium]|nr:YabP/YqfC family sporulation protein [Oscillospiraceae bacterium]
MGLLYEKLIELDELSSRECVITVKLNGNTDNAEIYVENCRKVLSCDNEFITLGVCGADIRVSGTPLTLENFGVGGVKITGKISSLDFSDGSTKGLVK